ncbi:MAG: hypothetical protein AB1782_16035 [Cyanobacteriota bacterium]
MKQKNQVITFILTLTILLFAGFFNITVAENKKITKVKIPTYISETETTGVTGSNEPLTLEEEDITEDVIEEVEEKYKTQEKPVEDIPVDPKK